MFFFIHVFWMYKLNKICQKKYKMKNRYTHVKLYNYNTETNKQTKKNKLGFYRVLMEKDQTVLAGKEMIEEVT